MVYYNEDSTKFMNGEKVKTVDEARYLGCMLNDEANAAKEISCMFWDLGFDWAGSLQERDLFQVPIFTMGSFRGLD